MNREDMSCEHDGGFPSTAWNLIDGAKDRSGSAEMANRLLCRYWKPVYGFLRVRGYPVSTAEDLTQEFFLRLLERDWLCRADAHRGRFRTFLLTLLVRFLSDQGADRIRRQQHFERGIVPVSALRAEEPGGWEPAVQESPEAVFCESWARALLEHACQEVGRRYAAEGHGRWYAWFEEHVLGEGSRRTSQSALARRDGVSRDQVRYAVEQVKRSLEEKIRSELVGDGCGEDALDAEVRGLIDALGH